MLFITSAQTKRFSTPEAKAAHAAMVRAACASDVDDSTREGIVRVLMENRYANVAAQALIDYRAGKEVDLLALGQLHLNDLKLALKTVDNIGGFIDTDIGDILTRMNDVKHGFKWRLDPLRRCMRPLQYGDFGIVAGRPDKGKTSFLASELTYLAPQLPEGRPILWLNNEGPGERIYPRLYQAALGITYTELVQHFQSGKLQQMYADVIGDPFRIRVKDVHGFNIGQIERVIEEQEPGIVVYDMIDNIKGFGDAARTDLMLEKMYQHCREFSVLYEHVGIATSQISNDGDGLLYPLMHMLKDSKTGKQGACDFQIMLGASNDPMMQSIRGIGIVKNKLMIPGQPKDPREEVQFNEATSRYTAIQE